MAAEQEAARIAAEQEQASLVAAELEAGRVAAELEAVKAARMAAELEAARVAEELDALEAERLAAAAARMPDERGAPSAGPMIDEMLTTRVPARGARSVSDARSAAENKAIAALFAAAAILFALSRRAKRRASS